MVDPAYLKRNIFAGESGGDYNALYGYANREGGQFAGTRLTDMTINQALQFADPSGPYAATVRGQVGRTATPMGAYQVVGSTLRDAMKGLGLTGNERFDEAMQDRVAQWIYQTQGSGAWEGWGGGGGNVTMSSKGGSGMVGLLDMGDEPQTFGQRLKNDWRSGDLMDRLALGFNTMRMNPDQGIAQVVSNRMTQRGEQRANDKATNRTAAWLASIGREDLAGAMLSGGLDPKQAAQLAMTPPEDNRTAMIQNYEYWISQGKTPEEAAEMAKAGAGGTTNNIDMGQKGDVKFEERFAGGDAELLNQTFATGLSAQTGLAKIDQLEALLQAAPTGGLAALKLYAGQFGINTDNLSELQAAEALISSLVPLQRPAGSGTMSDADLALFKASLPRIINSPDGNRIIIDTMRAIAKYDAEGARIVQMLRTPDPVTGKTADRAQVFQLLMDRPNPLAQFRVPQATATGGGTGTGTGPTVLRYDANGNRIP